MITPEHIRIRIRDLRRERALTQEALAEALGLSRQSVNAMEAGRNLPSLPVALEIASFFAVPLHVLFEVDNGQMQATRSDESDLENTELTPTRNQGKENPMVHIVPWSPLREMREMLDDMMDETANWSPAVPIAAPAVNISQDDKNVMVEMRLPGFKKEDLSIEVGEDFLTITGEVKHEEEKEEKNKVAPQYFRREFMSQSFSRSMSLPAQVQTDKAEAEMRHGVLFVTLPKVIEEKPKTSKIEIKS